MSQVFKSFFIFIFPFVVAIICFCIQRSVDDALFVSVCHSLRVISIINSAHHAVNSKLDGSLWQVRVEFPGQHIVEWHTDAQAWWSDFERIRRQSIQVSNRINNLTLNK